MHQVTRHQYHQSHEPWWKFLFEDSRTCIPKPLAKHCPTCVSNNEGFLGEVNLPNCSIDKNGVEKQSEVFNDEELENKHTYNIYKYVCKNIYIHIYSKTTWLSHVWKGDVKPAILFWPHTHLAAQATDGYHWVSETFALNTPRCQRRSFYVEGWWGQGAPALLEAIVNGCFWFP